MAKQQRTGAQRGRCDAECEKLGEKFRETHGISPVLPERDADHSAKYSTRIASVTIAPNSAIALAGMALPPENAAQQSAI